MATWKVRITGKQKSAPDVDLLLAAVLTLGRQLRDEQHRRSARRAREPQAASIPDTSREFASRSAPATPGQGAS
jgi:hypothetical protein